MDDDQLLRYSRHILLDDIGIEGQQKILEGHALVIGAGGLGCPAAMYLASSGVGRITLVDHDCVDLTNLQRQIGHTSASIGTPKVESLRNTLLRINPTIEVHTVAQKADQKLLQELVSQASVVLDCSDNYRTRHTVNAACVHHRVPLVAAAALRFDGQISVFDNRNSDSPCYACIFPPEADFEEVQCSTMGVFAPLVGIMGTIQAAEALKLLIGHELGLKGQLLILDGKSMQWSSIRTHKSCTCSVCNAS